MVKKHKNLDTGIDFIYVTLILLFFTANHELPYERNKNYVHKPRYCYVTKINQSQQKYKITFKVVNQLANISLFFLQYLTNPNKVGPK